MPSTSTSIHMRPGDQALAQKSPHGGRVILHGRDEIPALGDECLFFPSYEGARLVAEAINAAMALADAPAAERALAAQAAE